MAREYALFQLYIDVEYIRRDLQLMGIGPWFGPGELKRAVTHKPIDGKTPAVRRAIFYDAVDELADDREEHIKHLNELGKEDDTLVRLGVVIGSRNKRQKGVDMQIGRDMMIAAQSGLIEYFALASGDADFIPAIRQVQDLGPRVVVLAFKGSISEDLVSEADRVIYLPTNPDRNWSIR
ncbi:MAG: NYN domain-containing protein [Chloroflexi bacterium]|nr:NYN domain-containing protein [Chloroflexota bacterium]